MSHDFDLSREFGGKDRPSRRGPRDKPRSVHKVKRGADEQAVRPSQRRRAALRKALRSPTTSHDEVALQSRHANAGDRSDDDLVKRLESAGNLFVITDEVLRALTSAPTLARGLAVARSGDLRALDAAVAEPAVAQEFARPLATAALREMILPSLTLEAVLTRLRRQFLQVCVNPGPLPSAKVNFEAVLNIALQCWLNEFVWEETAEESLWVDIQESNVQSALLTNPGNAETGLAVLACYRPLYRLPRIADLALSRLPQRGGLSELIRVTIVEPRREADISKGFPRLESPADAISRAVKQQYEENPYPRWTRPLRHEPVTAQQHWQVVLPRDMARMAPVAEPLNILIAGCGTGHQVAAVASRLPNSNIHAIDLSSASLAYAKRKAEELALHNVTFELADILDLGSRPEFQGRFDYVECFGVLHHMANPAAGLQSLATCAKPGAVFYLGLYSRLGSGQVLAAQCAIADMGLQRTAKDIRRLRKMIALNILGGARLPFDPNGLEKFVDYYSTSMCRDLLFHVCEHFYDARAIKPLLDQAGLEFACFELPAGLAKERYFEEFPHDPRLADAEAFSVFEARRGGLGGIHRFYARKPS
ncbi:MAG: class I SAM-dependent methyltransferase [Rhodospirillaceae bacterium]|nr:class I SAM-dependent methyltransferase [Rhodospirillaceae bacterium]